MLLQADARQLVFLKALLHSFAESTGLKVNYSKSHMYPINVSNERMAHLASTFGCDIGTMPFTYLGLPMGTTKPRIEDFTPMMDRVERRLSVCLTWLSYSGRLEMVNSAITPITTYAMWWNSASGEAMTLRRKVETLWHGQLWWNPKRREVWVWLTFGYRITLFS